MDDPNTEEAFEFARSIHSFDWMTLYKLWAHSGSPAVTSAQVGILKYLAELTYTPWFERAWTFQEIILPPTVSLVCGKSSMPLQCLELCHNPATIPASADFSIQAKFISITRGIGDTYLEDQGRLPARHFQLLLNSRREAKMSDPRDYIFSLLGLFSPSVSLSLSSNYSISIKRLFTAVAKHIIYVSGELRILCSVESPKHIDGEAFPSWVPDWRASSERLQHDVHDWTPESRYKATRESVLDYDPSTGNELHLYGIPIGTVNQAGRCDDIHSIAIFNLGRKYNHTNQPVNAALRQAQALDADLAYESPITDFKMTSLKKLFDIPTETMEEAEEELGLGTIVQNCSENFRSRALFTTDSRHFGFGPNCTAVGDQIFLLISSNVPFILRPAGEKFELVGACYVHGIMYGEGLSENVHTNNQFYPSSARGTWDISKGKVPPAEWKLIEEDGDNSQIGGSVCHELAPTAWDTTSEDLKGSKTRRYSLREDGRSPVLINTQRVIIK